MGTLMAKNVKLNEPGLLAVIADDANLHVLILDWHRCLCNLPIHFSPEVFILIERNIANWTTQGLQPCARHLQLAEAVLVNRMAALQDGDLNCRLKQVLDADRAVLVHGILHTRVRVANLVGIATPTGVTVEIVFAPAHATDATLLAVENLLLNAVVIPEVTI